MNEAPRLPARRAQFSIRAALVAIACAAVALVFAQRLGTLAALFGVGSATAVVLLGGAWRRAFCVAWTATYAPFIAVATYTIACVPCMHCKTTYSLMAPIGPGVLAVMWGLQSLRLPRPPEAVAHVICFGVSVAILGALTWLVHATRVWRVVALIAVLAYSAFNAWALLMIVQA